MQYAPQNPSDPGHPDHDRYMNMRNMVERMHGESGIAANGDMNERATAAMFRAYKAEATRENASLDPRADVDGVVLSRGDVPGRYAIMYQGDPNNPTVRTLAVPTQDLTQPAERNFDEVNRINAQQGPQLTQAQAQEQVRQQGGQEQAPAQIGSRSLF
jgi:hypothetical protein